MQNHSYGYKFYLHVKENSFSYEWFHTWPRLEKEATSNSEMGHCVIQWIVIFPVNSAIHLSNNRSLIDSVTTV